MKSTSKKVHLKIVFKTRYRNKATNVSRQVVTEIWSSRRMHALAPSGVSILPWETSNIIFLLDVSAYLVDVFLTDQFTDVAWCHALNCFIKKWLFKKYEENVQRWLPKLRTNNKTTIIPLKFVECEEIITNSNLHTSLVILSPCIQFTHNYKWNNCKLQMLH